MAHFPKKFRGFNRYAYLPCFIANVVVNVHDVEIVPFDI